MPLRILHVIESLHVGAVENWLVGVFRASRANYPQIEWSFYCALGKTGRLDDIVLENGGKIIYPPVPISRTTQFLLNLRNTVKEGAYDVLHCHHDFMSGFYLLAAAGLTVRRRIVHVHNADLSLPTPSRLKAALLREPLRQLCLQMADQIVGISNHTLDTFLAGRRRRPNDRVVYYGMETAKFHAPAANPIQFRAWFNFAPNARVILFAGRMCWYKNPCFAMEMLRELSAMDPTVVGLFAGTGPLEIEVARMARDMGMEKQVRVLGWRDDTAALMQAADLLVFPRTEELKDDVGQEGLGLVVVEAQAAGLPILMSRGVPEDAIVVRELFEILPLSEGVGAWAKKSLEMLRRPRPDPARCLAQVERSRFSMRTGTESLLALYSEAS